MATFSAFADVDIDGTWTDATGYVRWEDGIQVRRGRTSEQGSVEASQAAMTLDNRDYRWSPRCPTGTWYGSLVRNTRMRVGVRAGDSYLVLSGTTLDRLVAPDSAGLSVTGDIDIRVDVTLEDWRQADVDLAGKYVGTGDQRSWALDIADGFLRLSWSPDGTSGATLTATSTVVVPWPPSRRLALRATLDVDNGASGNTTTFYTSDDIDGTWTQLGDAVVKSGTTSIYDSTADVCFGIWSTADTGTDEIVAGKLHAGQVRDGIGGSLVGDCDVRAVADGASSFSDGTNTWTVTGTNAEISNRKIRVVGEVPNWPARWDPTGTDIYSPVTVDGILRRLQQGNSPLQSPMRRAIGSIGASLVGYWPCEDGADATEFSSGLDGGNTGVWTGTPSLASDADFTGSQALPTISGATVTFTPNRHSDTGSVQIQGLFYVPAGTGTTWLVRARMNAGGTIRTAEVQFVSGGALYLRLKDVDGATIREDTIGFSVDGDHFWMSLELAENGSDVDRTLAVWVVGDSTGSTATHTETSQSLGKCRSVVVNPDAASVAVAVGHVTIENAVTGLSVRAGALDGWAGEAAGRRIERLCSEEGISFYPVGDLDETQALGEQGTDTLYAVLVEAADADGGILHEPREYFGIAYRTHRSMYTQAATATLDYDAGDLSEFEPVEDDQRLRNDVTVTRSGGGSTRRTLDSGALSTADPPDGAGRYDEEVTLSLETDAGTVRQAEWRRALGTVDEPRFPGLTVELARPNFTGDAALTAAMVALDVGGRLDVTGVPAWMAQDDVRQLVQGYAERIDQFLWRQTFVGSPARAWQVATYSTGSGPARYGMDGCTLNEDLDTTETGIDVTLSGTAAWGHDDGDYDIVIGGEVITVTAVGTPSAGVQTLTGSRSVNGVVKTHSTGAAVQLYEATRYGRQ